MGINLNDSLIKDDSKRIKEVLFDKDWNVKFKLAFLPKPELQMMIGRHTKIEFNKLSKAKEEALDSEALTADMLATCVKGWSGVTPKYLATLIPIDLAKFPDPNVEVDFSKENLDVIVKNGYGVDNWIIETIRNAANFTEKKEAEGKN